jgi:hypothetical protein
VAYDGNGTFVRTNGVFTGANVWAQDKTAEINILVERHDTHDQDIAQGLSQCLTKDGTQNPTGNLPMNAKKHTGVGDAVDGTDYGKVGQEMDALYLGAAENTSYAENDKRASNVGGINYTGYTAGMTVWAYSAKTNDVETDVTLRLGNASPFTEYEAITIFKGDGTAAVDTNDFVENQFYQVVFDPTTSNKWLLVDKVKQRNTYELADDAVIETKIGDLSDNVAFTTAGKGVDVTVASVTATGSVQGDAAALTNLFNMVSGADGTKGVRLPAVSSYIGMEITVTDITSGGGNLKFWPASGEGFAVFTVDKAIGTLANKSVTFMGLQTGSGDNWGVRSSSGLFTYP